MEGFIQYYDCDGCLDLRKFFLRACSLPYFCDLHIKLVQFSAYSNRAAFFAASPKTIFCSTFLSIVEEFTVQYGCRTTMQKIFSEFQDISKRGPRTCLLHFIGLCVFYKNIASKF